MGMCKKGRRWAPEIFTRAKPEQLRAAIRAVTDEPDDALRRLDRRQLAIRCAELANSSKYSEAILARFGRRHH